MAGVGFPLLRILETMYLSSCNDVILQNINSIKYPLVVLANTE